MKSQKGITLISVIITVVLLAIISGLAVTEGIETYNASKVSKFETYMKMIQKKVDLMLEEEIDYTNMGSKLTMEQKNKLQMIITGNPSIETRNIEEHKLRYFSSNDIESIFEISDINDEIIVNFANRDVISLNGVEHNGTMHYVEYTLH